MTTDTQLDTLEAKGLISVATLQPELEYLFRHALVQDAAYESLLKQERRELHQTVGEALEELYPERRSELASMLALHFEQAGDSVRAVSYLVDAAKYALDRNAIVEAYDLYGRAAALLPPATADETGDALRLRVDVNLGRIKSGYSFMTDQEQLDMFGDLVEEVERLGDLQVEADVHVNLAFIRQFRGDRPENSPLIRHSLERVETIARELNDPFIAAIPNALIGLFEVFTGEMVKGVQTLRDAIPLLEEKHAYVLSSFSNVALAIGLARLGRFEEAEEAAARAAKVAESGDLIARLDSMIAQSTVHSLKGDLEQAVRLGKQCTEMSEETGATACVVASNFTLGDAYVRQGQFKSAQIAFERSNEVAEAFNEHNFRPSLMAYMRANSAELGELAGDAESFDRGLELARNSGDKFSQAGIIGKRAEFEAKRPGGNREQAFADFADAVSRFEQMQAKPYVARILRSWGDALRAEDRRADGDEKLKRALSLFDEMGIKREADEVRAELAE
jgi:tetratricopeptide (TPR) repeat protein